MGQRRKDYKGDLVTSNVNRIKKIRSVNTFKHIVGSDLFSNKMCTKIGRE